MLRCRPRSTLVAASSPPAPIRFVYDVPTAVCGDGADSADLQLPLHVDLFDHLSPQSEACGDQLAPPSLSLGARGCECIE